MSWAVILIDFSWEQKIGCKSSSGCLTKGHPSCRGIIINPEGDPGEDGDQDGGHICLQDEISNVPLNPETQ